VIIADSEITGFGEALGGLFGYFRKTTASDRKYIFGFEN
jgi:hypothetical protein